MRVSGEDWVLANTNVSGYFRVNYDLDNWDRLLSLQNTNHQVSHMPSDLSNAAVVVWLCTVKGNMYIMHFNDGCRLAHSSSSSKLQPGLGTLANYIADAE